MRTTDAAGLDLGNSSADGRKRMNLGSAVKQTWQGWLRDSMSWGAEKGGLQDDA